MRTFSDSSGAQPMTPAERTGYDAEPPVTLRTQVLRRPPQPPSAPPTETTPSAEPAADSTSEPGADNTVWRPTAPPEEIPAAAPEPEPDSAEMMSVFRADLDAPTTAEMHWDAETTDFTSLGDEQIDDVDDDIEVVPPPSGDERESTPQRLIALVREALPRRHRGSGPYVPAVTVPRGDRSRPGLVTAGARHWKLVLGLVTGGVAVAVVVGLLVGSVIGGDSSHAPADPARVLATPDPTSDAVECPTKDDGAVSTGRGPGSQASGVEVIRAFNFAYYRWRNAQAARAMVSLRGKVGDVVDMQASIDLLAPGVRYCLAITDTGRNRYDVELTEISPAGAQRIIRQSVLTENIGGRWWITEFAKPRPKR